MNQLHPIQQQFILHWGEMGTRWGINRTVAQIHALLFLSPQPLPAEDIAETLGVARSNVSTSLKELQGWGIVKRVHVLGDKRDHFESMKEVWEMFRIVLDERKRREIDPTLAMLRECIRQAEKITAAIPTPGNALLTWRNSLKPPLRGTTRCVPGRRARCQNSSNWEPEYESLSAQALNRRFFRSYIL